MPIDDVLHGMSVFDAVVRSARQRTGSRPSPSRHAPRKSATGAHHGKADHHGRRATRARPIRTIHLCPPQEDIPGVAQQYIDAVNAGAAIAHIHGRRTLEETIQADGRQVSRIHHDDWKRLQDAIMSKVDPIMQFGVA